MDWLSLAQAIPYITAGLKGKDTKPQKGTTKEMQALARAQYDQNSPMFQNLYQQNRAGGQQDLASTIAEISRQNRKLISMGRNPLLSQERGGEQIFRNLIMGQEDVGRNARSDTMSQLRGAQNSLAGIYDAQTNLTNEDWDNRLRRAGSYYSIGDSLKGLFGLRKPQTQQQDYNPIFAQGGTPYQGEVIHWNTPRY